MKLASYKDGSRDGQLLVVSRDLTTAHYATGIATRLQQVLDDWNFLSPQLQELSQSLNHGKARHAFAFDPRLCLAPLPRAFHWAEVAENAAMPHWPHIVQGRSEHFLGACDTVRLPLVRQAGAEAGNNNGTASPGLTSQAQLAVVSGDIAPGTGPDAALDGVRLLMLVNSLAPAIEPRDPHASLVFAPVAVTLDEVGEAWQGGRLRLTLARQHNRQRLDPSELGGDAAWHAGTLLARIAAVHGLRSGAIVGCGAVAAPLALPLHAGDRLRLEVEGRDGQSVFGAIEPALAAADD